MSKQTTTSSVAASLAQTVMADRANAVEAEPAPPPLARVPPGARARAALQDMPPGFSDTVKEVKYEPREQDAFGAMDLGDRKIEGGPVEAGFMPAAPEIVDDKAPKAKPADDDVEAEAGAASDADAAAEATTEEAAEAAPVVELPKTGATKRREALDALRLAADNRKLVDTLQAERASRATAEAGWKAERDGQVAQAQKLRGAPLEERLKELGIETKEELLEMAITGKLNLPAERAPVAAKPAEVAPDRLAAVESELSQYRGQQLIRDQISAAGLGHAIDKVNQRAVDKWQAAGSKAGTEADYLKQAIAIEPYAAAFTKELTESAEIDIPISRTIPGRLDAIREAALGMWEQAGFAAGKHGEYLRKAADASEEMAREEMAPRLKAIGVDLPARGAKVTPKPAVPIPPAAPAPGAKVAAKPSPPVGKRLAARPAPNTDDDGLPLDPVQRDAVIKRDMAKAGHKGWGTSV